eukprot:3857368-Rhodomonas_salina.1
MIVLTALQVGDQWWGMEINTSTGRVTLFGDTNDTTTAVVATRQWCRGLVPNPKIYMVTENGWNVAQWLTTRTMGWEEEI